MKPDAPLLPGDVVQIDPEFVGNRAFAGCFVTVTEVKAWGAQGYVQVLGEDRATMGGRAYIRLTWDCMELVGKAAWMAE